MNHQQPPSTTMDSELLVLVPKKSKDDRLSNLPDEILHQIISLIPTLQSASTCFLSKRWRHLSKSFYSLDFDESLSETKLKKLVTQMLCHHNPSIDLHKFRLHLDLDTTWHNETEFLSLLDQWILRVVMFNVRDLDLMFWGVRMLYWLPECVFKCSSITTLRLTNCGVEDFSLGGMTLVSLRTLCLRKVEVGTGTLRELLSGCSALEYLCLELCDKLEALEGRSLSLKAIRVFKCYNLMSFKMDLPRIESFEILYNPFVVQWGFSTLKTISLSAEIDNRMFQDLITKCVLLENLYLIRCRGLNRIRIFSDRLKRLKLSNCPGLRMVELDAMGLTYFEYAGTKVVGLSQFNTTSKVDVKIELNDCKSQPDKLKTFLGMFNHVHLVTLVTDNAESVLIPEELLENSLPPLYHLTHLKFKAGSKLNSGSYSKVLNGVLSLSVHIEVLMICLGSLHINLKFEPKKTVELQDFPSLNWTELPVEHLRCRLKEADIIDFGRNTDEMNQLVTFIFGKDAVMSGMAFTSTYNHFSWQASK